MNLWGCMSVLALLEVMLLNSIKRQVVSVEYHELPR